MDYSAYEAEFGLWLTKAESQVVIVDTQLSKYSSYISDTVHKVEARNPVDNSFRNQTTQTTIIPILKVKMITLYWRTEKQWLVLESIFIISINLSDSFNFKYFYFQLNGIYL